MRHGSEAVSAAARDSAQVEGVAVHDHGATAPLADSLAITTELLQWLGGRRLSGLQVVVLTNSSSLDQRRRIRVEGRSIREAECESFYHLKTRDREPWIELIIDNIAKGLPAKLLRFRVFREFVLARALFHEVAHHASRVVSGQRSLEDEAEAWSRRQVRAYFTETHRVLAFLVRVFLAVRRKPNNDRASH